MLITQLKAKEAITSLIAGKKVFIINCHGCKEVHFPEKEAVELQKELSAEGNVTGIMTTDYICNPENMELRLQKHMSKIQEADMVLVFSCEMCIRDRIKAYFNGHIPALIGFGMKVVLSIVAFYVGTKLIKWLLKVAKRSDVYKRQNRYRAYPP